jgi:Flp pilus assembly protein TadG
MMTKETLKFFFRDDARGAAAVEFALVALFLVGGLINAAEVGRYEYQLLQVENAAEVGAQTAWTVCNNLATMVPATTNCTGLNSAMTTAIQSTNLGTAVKLASGYPAEGYYCVNTTTNALQLVGGVTSKPANCSAAGNASVGPGDYIQVGVSFTYTPLFTGMTVMGSSSQSIFRTSWMRLS